MYHSTGIDNLEIILKVTLADESALRNLCTYKRPPSYILFDQEDTLIRRFKRDDEMRYVLLNDYEDPKIILRFAHGKVFANLNVPKLAFGHNVRLAGPKEIALAIRTLEQNTSKAAPRLNWKRAEVSLLHPNHTREVPNYEHFRSLVRTPRGYWPYDDNYSNANRKNLPVCKYDKAQQFRDDGKEFPRDVMKEMESLENDLFRFEPRLNQSPCSALRTHGGWNGNYLLAEDLINGPGYIAALTYLQWQFKRHIPIPSLRLPALGKNPSVRAYAQHNVRTTAFENPARLREHALADHDAGTINAEVFGAEIERADLLERRHRALSLHQILSQECGKQIAEILVTMKVQTNIDGLVQIQEIETEHAAREYGHTESLPGYPIGA
jgi:hypothetical protein